jgi:large subunit ribosomal protein L4
MPTANVYNLSGDPVSDIDLPDDVFNVDRYDHLLHEMVRYSQAHRRQGTACTKTRSAVRGGGRKMFRQKGTGRARHGGSRAPQFRGGGVAHGPQPRSYAFKLNKKVRRNAMKSALTRRASSGSVIVFENLDLAEIKTKPVVELLAKLGIKSALVVTSEVNDTMVRSARNIPYVKVLPEAGLNVEDILRHAHLVLTTASVAKIASRFSA